MDMNKKNDFKFDIPSGYFDTLADRVMDRIQIEDTKNKRRKSLIFKITVALAACIAGFGIYNSLFMPKHSVILQSERDYVSQYKLDIVSKLSDVNLLDYMTTSSSEITRSSVDYTDIVNDYPLPITYY